MATIATGQISIVDYNDALTLTGFITANHPKTQVYNQDNDTFSPDWSATNLVLTPSLFKLGSSTDIIDSANVQSITWYNAKDTTVSLATTKTLTRTTNLDTENAVDYICQIEYLDDKTGLTLVHKIGISFNKAVNGSGIADAVAWLPDGNIFKNGNVSSLKAECNLWRGSTIDTTYVSYQWYKKDSSVTTDEGGGVGWKKLTNVTGSTENVTTNTMTVYDGAVLNMGIFKCVISDNDTSSNTYGESFEDTVTIIDQSDPIQVTVTSSGGDVFKNGVGSTTLTAKLFRNGVDGEIDSAGTKYTYKWYKYDKNGALVTGWGGTTDYKTGRELSVGDADVDTKATFSVEIE